MTRDKESWQKQLQRNRDEMRRLDNLHFWAGIILTLIGFAAIGVILYWAVIHTAITLIGIAP